MSRCWATLHDCFFFTHGLQWDVQIVRAQTDKPLWFYYTCKSCSDTQNAQTCLNSKCSLLPLKCTVFEVLLWHTLRVIGGQWTASQLIVATICSSTKQKNYKWGHNTVCQPLKAIVVTALIFWSFYIYIHENQNVKIKKAQLLQNRKGIVPPKNKTVSSFTHIRLFFSVDI